MTQTLPADRYTDPAPSELERRAVWRGGWLAFCPAVEAGRPGQYSAAEVAGFPVVVAVEPDCVWFQRRLDEQISAVSTVGAVDR